MLMRFRHHKEAPSVLYVPCDNCAGPTFTQTAKITQKDSATHKCYTRLSGQTWWSMTRIVYKDTKLFSIRVPGIAHVQALTVWSSTFVNGFQMTIDDVANATMYTSPEYWGNHNAPTSTTVTFDPNELIVRCGIKAGDVVDQLWIETTKGHRYTFGKQGGSEVLVDIPQGLAITGIFGGIGGHVHHLGFFLDEIRNVLFARRRVYFLIRYKSSHTLELLNSDLGFLVTLPSNMFREIVLYL